MSSLGQRSVVVVTYWGRSETTSYYQGASVEHRSIVETRGKLLLACAVPGTELTVLQDEGPLELTLHQKVLGWGDEVESTHEMFKTEGEDNDHDENDDPFEDHQDRPSSPHAPGHSPLPPEAPFVRPSNRNLCRVLRSGLGDSLT